MNRDEVWQAIDDERLSLADLFDDLSAAEWETASLCDGWRVRDVAAHLTLAQLGTFPAAMATLRARGNMGRMIHDTAVRQARLPVGQYAVLLRGMAGSRKKAPGVTDLEPLIDVLVHGQDIAIPLGRTRPMRPRRQPPPHPGLARSVAVPRAAEAGRFPARCDRPAVVRRGGPACRGPDRGDPSVADRPGGRASAAVRRRSPRARGADGCPQPGVTRRRSGPGDARQRDLGEGASPEVARGVA